jgi:hypothetical protein
MAFSRSIRSLNAASSRRSTLGLVLVVAILGAWVAWFLLARVSVYEVTDTARLQVAQKVVADFPPSALGRIQPGQSARLHLDGFPWPQYGSVSASVISVRNKARDGRVRVEFVVHPDPTSRIPLQHGLPGTVEVEVDRLSPAELIIRAAGQRIGVTKSNGE